MHDHENDGLENDGVILANSERNYGVLENTGLKNDVQGRRQTSHVAYVTSTVAVADVSGPLCCAVLLFVNVDAVVVVVVVVVDLLSEIKPGAVYHKAVAYGAQKLKFRVCSSMITARDACLDAGVILKMYLFLWSSYSNGAFQAPQCLPFCRR